MSLAVAFAVYRAVFWRMPYIHLENEPNQELPISANFIYSL